MLTEKEMLNKILWDDSMCGYDYTIGYYDRVHKKIFEVVIEEMRMEPGNKFNFNILDGEGNIIHIPFHRIRTIKRDGDLIWDRKVEEK